MKEVVYNKMQILIFTYNNCAHYKKNISEILRHPKVFSFLHIPVQAGSDRVLTAMNREYTVAEFRKVADYLLVR